MGALVDEVRGAAFGDARLDERLEKVIEELGKQPNLSIPAATDKRAEMEGAYRFFDNDKVTPEKILQPHFEATKERISQCDLALFVQDTSEFDLTRPNQQVRGAGPMDSEKRRGVFFHPLQAFNIDAIPLGMIWQKYWTRQTVEESLDKQEKKTKRKQTPIEDKESIRWVEAVRATREAAASCRDTTCVCVGDSESDIYEVFSEPRMIPREIATPNLQARSPADSQHDTPTNEIHFLVRACQTRATSDRSNWLTAVRDTDCLYTCSVDVSKRTAKIAENLKTSPREKSRDARIAEVEVRATTVTLRPPARPDRKLPSITVNVVLVEETDPPEGCDPISWLLITTLPIDTSDQVKLIVRAYCIRWQIEIYFKTLKSGCRVERRQFETLERLMNSVAVYSIIAWRIMYLCRLGRECPDLDCEVVFEPSEWKAVYVALKRQDPPAKPPCLNEVIRIIATLGGYVDRRSTEPGPQTLWTGLQRVHDLSTAWKAFGPDS